MMSTQYTTPPKRMLADMLTSLNTNSEDGCFEAFRKIGKWATEQNVAEIILPVDDELRETLGKRLRQVQRAKIIPETLTITLVPAQQAA